MVYAHPNGVGMGGEELRGYATADQLVGDRQAFVTFYYNDGEEAPIEFRVWEASTGVTRSLAEVYYPASNQVPCRA